MYVSAVGLLYTSGCEFPGWGSLEQAQSWFTPLVVVTDLGCAGKFGSGTPLVCVGSEQRHEQATSPLVSGGDRRLDQHSPNAATRMELIQHSAGAVDGQQPPWPVACGLWPAGSALCVFLVGPGHGSDTPMRPSCAPQPLLPQTLRSLKAIPAPPGMRAQCPCPNPNALPDRYHTEQE